MAQFLNKTTSLQHQCLFLSIMHSKNRRTYINHCVLQGVKSFLTRQRNGVPDPCILIPVSSFFRGKVPWGISWLESPALSMQGEEQEYKTEEHVAQGLSVNAQLVSSMKLYPESVCQLAFLSLCWVLITGRNHPICVYYYMKSGYSKSGYCCFIWAKLSGHVNLIKLCSCIELTCNPSYCVCAVRESDSTFVPGRCLCPQTQPGVRGQLKELSVYPKSPSCDKVTVM